MVGVNNNCKLNWVKSSIAPAINCTSILGFHLEMKRISDAPWNLVSKLQFKWDEEISEGGCKFLINMDITAFIPVSTGFFFLCVGVFFFNILGFVVKINNS